MKLADGVSGACGGKILVGPTNSRLKIMAGRFHAVRGGRRHEEIVSHLGPGLAFLAFEVVLTI